MALVDELLARPDPGRPGGRPGDPRPDRAGRRSPTIPRGEGPFAPRGRERDRPGRGARPRCGRSRRSGPSDPSASRSATASATPTPGSGSRRSAWPLEPKAKVAEASLCAGPSTIRHPAARIALLERIGAEPRLRSDLRLIGVVSGGLLADGRRGPREGAPAHPEDRHSSPTRRSRGPCASSRGPKPPASGIARSPGRCWPRAADRAAATRPPTGSTSPTSRPRSCRSSTGWPRTARTAWAATARTRSCGWSRPARTASGRRTPSGPITDRPCGW